MIKLFLDNKKGKEELANYLVNTIGQSYISLDVLIVEKELKADMIIDLNDLETKEQVVKSMPVILNELLKAKIRKMPKVKVQPGQKKIRR